MEKLKYGDETLEINYNFVKEWPILHKNEIGSNFRLKTLRQSFLDMIDLEDVEPFVERVLYSPYYLSDNEGEALMATYPGFSLEWSKWMITERRSEKSTIAIYPLAFNRLDLGEFLGLLIGHEGKHARDFVERKDLFFPNSSLKLTERELRAEENSLDFMDSKKMFSSNRFKLGRLEVIYLYQQILQE